MLLSGNFALKKVADAFQKEHGIRISFSFKLQRFVGNLKYLMEPGKKPSTDLDTKACEDDLACADLREAQKKIRDLGVPLENVTEVLRSSAWTEARETLVNNGYSIIVLRVNSAACGVSQIRRRVFCCNVSSDASAYICSDVSEA